MDLRHTHRLFTSIDLAEGAVFTPDDEQNHYLLHVLRLKTGDNVRIFNGLQGEFRAEVELVSKRDVSLKIHEQLRPQILDPDLWLCPALIKKAHFEFMLEKATELGVQEIQPVLTLRTQIREINHERAYTICRESAEQSERLSVPALGHPIHLDDFISVFPGDRSLIVCAELGEAAPINRALSKLAPPPTKAALITGPEGGFAPEELEKLRQVPNALFVRLGPRILRADTAAIAALACWQAIQGDWNTIP